MEDTVHPFEGTVQGFFIADIRLKQRRKRRGPEVWVQGRDTTVHLARSQPWSPDPTLAKLL